MTSDLQIQFPSNEVFYSICGELLTTNHSECSEYTHMQEKAQRDLANFNLLQEKKAKGHCEFVYSYLL